MECVMAAIALPDWRRNMTERELTRQIIELLRVLGAWTLKVHGHLGQRRGTPDIVGCFRGRFFGFEVKSPQARRGLTAEQARELEAIRAAGGIAAEVRSLEDVVAALRQVDAEMDRRVRL